MKRTLAALLLLLVCWGCTRESAKQSGPVTSGGPSSESGVALPVITYADLTTPDATAGNPLVVSYTAAGGEGRPEMFTFRWYVDGALVDGANRKVLEQQNFRKGSRVEAEVIPTDGKQQGAPFRTKAVVIKNTPPVVLSAVLNPVPIFVGELVSVNATGQDRDGDTVTFEVQWLVNSKNATANEKGQLNTAGLKKRDSIAAMVTPFDGEDRGTPIFTSYIAISNRNPDITSTPPSGLQNGVYLYQVTAEDKDGDPILYKLVTAPPGMTIDRATGSIKWDAPSGGDKQQLTVKIAADDGDGGVSYQEFSMTLEQK